MQDYFCPDRLQEVDQDFLSFELERATQEDKNNILFCIENQIKLPNPNNSILLYLTKVTDKFDFKKGRSETIGGAPPDIDIDFEQFGKDKLLDIVVDLWGRDQVANIGTVNTLKPKSATDKFFSITEPDHLDENIKSKLLFNHWQKYKEIKDSIPKAIYGFEASLKEIIEGNPDKNIPPHPHLLDPKYKDWYEFVSYVEGMVFTTGVHPAGIVLSNEPIYNNIPILKTKDKPRVTQFTMNEVEALGLLKFDFLVILNLDIIKLTVKLIKQIHNIDIDIYNIEDYDAKAYALLSSGNLVGIFQMETSKSALDLITTIKPTSIEELSDISAMNRPGPLEAGFDKLYIQNKENQYPPENMHPEVARLTEKTYWTILYQEQVMSIVSELAGYDMQRTDDIRRIMG